VAKVAYPRKFKSLLETKKGEVEEPVEVWLAYAVCGIDERSCGRSGWILESAIAKSGQLPADTKQICPSCGKETFRTEVSVKYEQSKDQSAK